MREYTMEIAGSVYIGQTASAKNQLEANVFICENVGLMNALIEGNKPAVLVMFVGGLGVDKLRKLERLVVTGLITSEEGIPVADNLFVENMQDYLLLLGTALRENVQGFLTLLNQTTATQEAGTQEQ